MVWRAHGAGVGQSEHASRTIQSQLQAQSGPVFLVAGAVSAHRQAW